MLRFVTPLLLVAFCVACSAADKSAERHLQPAQGIDLAHCLLAIEDKAPVEPARCPGFLIEPLTEALQSCAGVGGKLVPAKTAQIWTMDVNGDNKKEFTFQYEGNVECEGAPSLFSCGSLGCPMALYEEHGAWRGIAAIYADVPESIELLDSAAGKHYGDLRVGCIGDQPCTEYWFYQWTDDQYERTHLEVHGFRVDFAGSVHGLYSLAGEITLLATPTPDGRSIGRYGADTEVAIIGTAEGADYYYVSPCNACESGFIPKSAVSLRR